MLSFCLLLVLCGAVCVDSQTTGSCTAGSTLITPGQMSSGEGFFANLMDQASCAGTVVAWHYCYYTDVSSGETYEFDAAMYRVQSDDDLILVSGSVSRIVRTASQINTLASGRSFVCETEILTGSNQFEVEEGDIVAVCMRQRGGNEALPLVSEDISGSNLATGSEDLCNSLDRISANDVSNQVTDATIHLYAEIMRPTLPPEIPSTTTTSASTMSTQTPEMPSTTTTSASTMSTQTPEMPSTTTTSASTMSTQTEPPTTTTGVQQPNATEGMGDESTTEDVNTLSSDQNNNTQTTTEPGRVGNNTPPVATIIAVVVVLLLALIAVTVVTIVVVLYWRYKQNRKSKTVYDVQPDHETTGIENAVYGLPAGNLDNQYEAIAVNGPIQMPMYEIPFSSLGKGYKPPIPPLSTMSSEKSIPIYEYAEFGPDLELNQKKDIYANLSPYCIPASGEDELYEQLKAFGIRSVQRKDIEVVSHLGSGQFGSVDQGVWRRPNDSAVDVALKTLKEGASEQDKVRFLQEGAIMAQFKHPNVISLHGVVSQEPLLLVVECMSKRDLRHFLITARPDSGDISKPEFTHLLLSFSRQVALGMQYLTGKKFVHRDLAARNILVSSDNVCKVADFGMSRDLADENYYIAHGGKIPVKWTAPEALHFKKYSTASDVWSYGCLLYEIWSIGHKPFEDKHNPEVLHLIDSGYRLPPPPGCPRRVYELMIAAWHPKSSSRPGFRDLLLALMMNEEEVLCVPSGHEEGSQAGVLGAPLQKGEALYPELQRKYC